MTALEANVGPRPWWFFALPLMTATFAVGADAWAVAGFLPQLARDLHVSVATAGLSVSCFALTYALCAPVLSALTSGIAPRRLIAAALLGLGTANAISALATGFGQFIVGRMIAALAACVVTSPACLLAARTVAESHRGRALSLVISGLTIATAVGVPLGAVTAQRWTWRQALLGVSCLCLISAVGVSLTAPAVPAASRQRIHERFSPLADHRVLSVLSLSVLGMTAAYIPYAYTTQIVPTASPGWQAALLAAYGFGAVCGSLASGQASDRNGPTAVLTVSYSVMAVAYLAFALQPGVMTCLLIAAAWGAASWTQTPAQQHRLLAIGTSNPAVAVGTNASAVYLGVAAGTATGGALVSHGPVTLCLAACGAAALSIGWNSKLARSTPGTARTPDKPRRRS